MVFLRKTILVIIVLLLIAIVLGFFSFLHPLCDSFAHFRIHFFIFLMVFLALLWPFASKKETYVIAVGILICVTYLGMILTKKHHPSSCQKTLKMIQFNLRFDNQHLDKLSAFLQKESIDIATFQEVTYKHKEKIEALKKMYPYQAYCEFATVGGVMLISKYPFTQKGGCLEKEGLVWREIAMEEKTFSLVSLHLHWPFPFSQAKQIDRLSQELENIQGPVIIAGDFNAVPWSYAVERLAQASHSKLIDGMRWSVNADILGIPVRLPIDHILVRDFTVSDIWVAPDLGSDHRPIVGTVCMGTNKL